MADTQTLKGFKMNLFSSEEVYEKLLKAGQVDENDLNLVEGEDKFDDEPTENSPNFLTSGAVHAAFKEAEPRALTNKEIEALISGFTE